MVNRVDWQLGRLLEALDATGAGGRTWVFHLTDHGEYLGDYGLIEKWPAGLDDCLLRNPLVIAGPACAAGGRCGAMVEMVDLTPTLLELAGVEASYTHFGRSLVPLLRDPSGPHRQAVFSEGGHRLDEPHVIEEAGPPYHLKARVQQDRPQTLGRAISVRTPEWTYVRRRYDTDELYDRGVDPGETDNLIDDPAHAELVGELGQYITDWLMDTVDVVPWDRDPRFPGRDEMSGPYPGRRGWAGGIGD